MEEGGDEIDPLDAFMAENDGAAAAAISAAQPAAAATQQAADDDEEADPLDAFMAAEVLPAVKQEPGAAVAPGVREQPPALLKAEAPSAAPLGVLPEAANGIAGVVAAGAGPADKSAVVKPRARRRYVDSDDSSDDEAESASEDDEVCFARFSYSACTSAHLVWVGLLHQCLRGKIRLWGYRTQLHSA